MKRITHITNKAPLLVILFILGSVIIYGVESMMFGFSTGYIYFVLGSIIILFIVLYFRFYRE